MKLNRKWFLVIALVMSLTMATAGTLAYLTDRDSEANVFTVGNVEIDLKEEFDQGATLIPGVNIDKKPVVENIGNNDAWVWAEIAIPSELNSTATASKNVIHFNMSADSVVDGKWNWWDGADYSEGAYMIKQKTINGVAYDVYVVQYETALKPGDVTEEMIYKVYLDPHVDIDPDGNWAWVESGVVTPINWNSKTNGGPVIYVSAYAMQTEGFKTVYDAYDAYQTQWGDNGTEWGDPDDGESETNYGDDNNVKYEVPANAVEVSSANELKAKVADGETVFLLKAGEYDIDGCGGKTLTLIGEDPNNTVIKIVGTGVGEGNGQIDYGFDGSTVTFQNLTIETNNQTYAGYARLKGTYLNVNFENCYCLNGDSVFENCTLNVSGDQYNVWTWGAPTAKFTHCTFNSDGKAVLLYGTADTKLTIEDCLFNDKGALPDLKAAIEIGNDYSKSYELVVNHTKVNGYEINDKGINTGTTLWANKNSMGTDKLNVVVDGVDVY